MIQTQLDFLTSCFGKEELLASDDNCGFRLLTSLCYVLQGQMQVHRGTSSLLK